MESFNKRVAAVLIKRTETKKRKAQMDMQKMQEEKKVDPKIKILDHMYETLSDEDCSSALDCLYKLTSQLHLEDEVSFDIPEDHDEHSEHDDSSDEGDHEFRNVHTHEDSDQMPEDHIKDLSTED
jgi:hypothetical protein